MYAKSSYGLILVPLLFARIVTRSQNVLAPGFHVHEYLAMLRMDFTTKDSLTQALLPDTGFKVNAPENYVRYFRSPEVGFKNRWSIWYRRDEKLAVISIRGTISDAAT